MSISFSLLTFRDLYSHFSVSLYSQHRAGPLRDRWCGLALRRGVMGKGEMSREEMEGKMRGSNDVNIIHVYEILKDLIKNHFAL